MLFHLRLLTARNLLWWTVTALVLIQNRDASGAPAGLLAYDGFNYAPGSILTGQSGGIGWSNGWVDVSANASGTVRAGNLPTAENAPAGYDKRSVGNAAWVANDSRSGRWLDCSGTGTFAQAGYLNGSGAIGAPGKTLYVSFLQQPSSPAQFYEFEFHRGGLGDPGRIGGIGNDLANATTVNLRAPNGAQTPFGIGNSNVNLYIVRIDYHGGSDDVFVYRNPTGQDEADNEPVLTMPGIGNMSFNGIATAAYLNGVTVSHDEIRLGTTWASVLGDPPSFVVQPTNQFACVGQEVTFTAQAQASEPLSYQWYRGAGALAGRTGASLPLSNVQLADAGQYWVSVSNTLGLAISRKAALTVQTLSAAIDAPQPLALGPGSNLVISAAIYATPPVALQWCRNGVAIPGATNATYEEAGTGFFGAGQYALVASNAYGCVTSSVATAFPDLGGLLAYEGFSYGQSSSDIAGAHGGFGWAGAWVNVGGGSSRSFSNSLPAGGSAPPGFDSHSAGGSLWVANTSRKGRFLDCSATGAFALHGYLDRNGNIGADGKTLYVSFLQQPGAVAPFYEFELKRGLLEDGGRMAGIGNDTGDSHAHFRSESPPGGASTFRDLGPGSTSVNFYVLRIDFKPGNDDVFVYRNPISPTEPPSPALTVSNVADMSFNGISLAAYLNNVTVSHDEVRVGMTWEDVVGSTLSQLQWAQRTKGLSCLVLAASPNCDYQMQAADAPGGPWTNIGSLTVPGLGLASFVESNATSAQRFYRALNGTASAGPVSGDVVLSRTLLLTDSLLNLPVKNGAPTKRVTLTVGGSRVRDFDIELADAMPDWWACVDVAPFLGQTVTVSVNSLAPGSTGLSSIVQTNGIVGATNLYQETLRPQLHFSSRRGWLNDPNGLVWNQGEYHLYYQHNPYGWNWGDMHWGHAVSSNLVEWTELPIGIYPRQYGDWAFSGSAVVDMANTAGFQSGTEPPMIAAYTSTGRGQCIAFSNDRGRTFTEYSGNPVVVNNGRDPRLLWYAPSNYWVMAVYDATGADGIAFYTSPNLRQWTYRSRINGFYECPDLFPLPVDGQTNQVKWVLSDASSGYMLGQFNGAVFTAETAKLPGNRGSAFYAAQTFSRMPSGDSRRVRIGWAQISMPGMPFNQMMYFPTELTLRTLPAGVRLCAQPVAELANLVANQYVWTNLSLSPGINPLSGIRGTLFDVKAQFAPGTAQNVTFSFQGVTVTYNCSAQTLSCNGVSASLAPANGLVQLEILVDRDSVELFGNSGELYVPLPAANPVSSSLVTLGCIGGTATFNSLVVSKLESAWPQPQN